VTKSSDHAAPYRRGGQDYLFAVLVGKTVNYPGTIVIIEAGSHGGVPRRCMNASVAIRLYNEFKELGSLTKKISVI